MCEELTDVKRNLKSWYEDLDVEGACNFAPLSRIPSNFPFKKMLQSIGWDVGCDSRILGEWTSSKTWGDCVLDAGTFHLQSLSVPTLLLDQWHQGTGKSMANCQCPVLIVGILGGLDAFLPWRWWHALEEAPCFGVVVFSQKCWRMIPGFYG